MNQEIENQAVETLALRFVADYKLSDPELARRIGERAAELIDQGGINLSTEVTIRPEDSKKAFAKVQLDSTIVGSFKSEALNAAISVLEARAAEICTWPEGFTLRFSVGSYGSFDDYESQVATDIDYLDVHGKKRKISECLGSPYKAKLPTLLGRQITRVNALVKMAGRLEVEKA